MALKTPKGKAKSAAPGEHPDPPTSGADAVLWEVYKEQLRAYNNEMEALNLEKRAALSSGSSASVMSGTPPSPYHYKEMKLDTWDGDLSP